MKVNAEEKALLDPSQPLSNGGDKKVNDKNDIEMTTTVRQSPMNMNRMRSTK
jgi:hypothetical protein